MKIIAIDDEPLALDLIENFCNQIDNVKLEKTFTQTNQALHFLQQNNVDLLLLDINMPAISGVEFYKQLDCKPLLIFTTSYSEFALESYNLGAVDYLLKPFTFLRFEKAIQRAYDTHSLLQNASITRQENFIMLKADYSIVKVMLDEILFVEGLDNYLKIHLTNKQSIVARMTMKALNDRLPINSFVRVHRSYLISLKHIESIKQKIITIAGEEIPVGKNYENDLKDKLPKIWSI